MGKTSFSVKALSKLAPGTKRYNVFDSDTRGLGIAVHPSGQKTFFHLRKVMGWPRRTTLGAFPDWSIELARGKAEELNSKLAKWKSNDYQGTNPLEAPRKTSTLGEILEHYVQFHLMKSKEIKNPEQATKYARWQFDRYLASWRNRPLGTILREHVRELHGEITAKHGAVTANRTLTFARTLFNHAIDPEWQLWDGANPCAKPEKILNQEHGRERVIRREEAPMFFAALEKEKHADLRDFILIALSTAARRGTIFTMKWEQIDWERGLWVIPSPKGRRGRSAHIVPLTKLALSVLKARPKVNEWVFPGRNTHLTTVKKPWQAFLKRTGIENLTVHDLRRSLATAEGDVGGSTEVIQKTLGHAEDSAATRIYDRSDRRDDVREVMDNAVRSLLSAGKTNKQRLLAP